MECGGVMSAPQERWHAGVKGREVGGTPLFCYLFPTTVNQRIPSQNIDNFSGAFVVVFFLFCFVLHLLKLISAICFKNNDWNK